MSGDLFLDKIEELNNIELQFYTLVSKDTLLDYDDVYGITLGLVSDKMKFKLKYLPKYFSYRKYCKTYDRISDTILRNFKEIIDEHNKNILRSEKENFKNICGWVENKELDSQQVDAIVGRNRNQLVIAGAGAGKTTTIVGKVKYLLLTKQYKPEDILLLSFTNASASEMKERIKKETGIDLDVMTFHKLGLEIIKKCLGENVRIFNKDLELIIKKIIDEKMKDPDYLGKLTYFISNARFHERDEFDFSNEEEYETYLSSNKPTTLRGEAVKSYGELMIANYLFRNSIEYVYEEDYKYETMTDEFQQYRPDFYLPEYDIYIEYFGIDENGRVAPYFKGKNGKSASEVYNESIEWKRRTHKENDTVMIESFYYENKQGKLLENLEKKLRGRNVKMRHKTDMEIWNFLQENKKGLLSQVCRLLGTVVNLIKSGGYSIDYLYSLSEISLSELNRITLDLVKPIYESYQKELSDGGQIDFNDMINMATVCVGKNYYRHNYKYVIVDEYQDISRARYGLLKAMREQKEYKLFCVGDDWQSIYRFSGSDISLIIDFEKYWGYTYISYIERTYRFTTTISLLSGNFIMRNPYQYKKYINAREDDNNSVIKFIKGYTEKKCVDFLEERLDGIEEYSTVYLLGRYAFDVDIFKNSCNFTTKYNNLEKLVDIIYLRRMDLKIKFLTIHKSKGLQADYVVIINNKKYGMGFPNRISDLPLIRFLSGGLDEFPFSEEKKAVLCCVD